MYIICAIYCKFFLYILLHSFLFNSLQFHSYGNWPNEELLIYSVIIRFLFACLASLLRTICFSSIQKFEVLLARNNLHINDKLTGQLFIRSRSSLAKASIETMRSTFKLIKVLERNSSQWLIIKNEKKMQEKKVILYELINTAITISLRRITFLDLSRCIISLELSNDVWTRYRAQQHWFDSGQQSSNSLRAFALYECW